MGEYRNDLDAAHQRIAALESELAEKRAEKAAPSTKRARRGAGEDDAPPPREVGPEQREFEAHMKGTAVSTRMKLVQWAGVLGFLAVHALIARFTIVPHVDGWTVFFVFAPLLPVVFALIAGRYVRALVDPAVGFFDHGDPENGRPPSIVHYTRRHAGIGLAVLAVLEVGWSVWLVPTMQHAMRSDCPACSHREPAR